MCSKESTNIYLFGFNRVFLHKYSVWLWILKLGQVVPMFFSSLGYRNGIFHHQWIYDARNSFFFVWKSVCLESHFFVFEISPTMILVFESLSTNMKFLLVFGMNFIPVILRIACLHRVSVSRVHDAKYSFSLPRNQFAWKPVFMETNFLVFEKFPINLNDTKLLVESLLTYMKVLLGLSVNFPPVILPIPHLRKVSVFRIYVAKNSFFFAWKPDYMETNLKYPQQFGTAF